MAAGFVQGRSLASNGATISLAYLSPNTAGNLLICGPGEGDNGDQLTGVADGGNNTWILGPEFTQNAAVHSSIWHVLSAVAATPTVTVTHSASKFAANISIIEFDGGTWSLGPETSAGGFGTAINSGNVTTTVADAVLVGVTVGSSAGATFTNDAAFTELADTGSNRPLHVQYRLMTSTVTDANTSTLSASANWAALIASYYVSGAAPSVTLSGTAVAGGVTEAEIVAGGQTVIATLTGDTYVAAAVTPSITYVGGQTGSRAGSTATSNVTFALTGGTNASPLAGDFVLIAVGVGTAARNPAQAVSGYTAYGQLSEASQTADTSQDVSWKVMGGTPDTTFTLPSTGNNADAQSYTVQVFRDVDPTTPDDVTSTTATGAGTGRPDPPSITPATAGACVVICGHGAAATGATYTGPANFTTGFLTASGVDTTDSMVGSGYWLNRPAGVAVDAAAYTGGTTGATDSWVARTICLKPAPGTTPFDDARQAIIDGLDSDQAEVAGWDAVRSSIPVTAVVRTSDTVATITLPALPAYDITASETVTATVPGSALTLGTPIVATPTFTITPSVAVFRHRPNRPILQAVNRASTY